MVECLFACCSLFLTPGRMAPDGDLVNADVAVISMQPKLRATSRMASLVSMIVDFSHVMNAQLRLLGKAKAPFSVRLRGRAQLSGSGEVVLGEGVSLNGTVVPIELVTYEFGTDRNRRTYIHQLRIIHCRASFGEDRLLLSSRALHVRDGQRPARCRQALGIAAVGSGYHRRQCLDRLKSGHPSRRPHWQPRSNRCRQHRHQGYSSAMCCRGKSCARASSPHGARLTHVLVFGLLIGTRWAER